MKKYVSDEISKKTLKNLNSDTHYLILAGTGSGKTHFIKNVFREFVLENSKRLLVLVNRTTLKNQTRADIDNSEMIEGFYYDDDLQVLNYQSLSEQEDGFLDSFDYIVCDEVHYFVADSWNGRTQDEFEMVKNSKAIKVYMTATYKTFMKLFGENDKLEKLYKQYGIDFNLSNMYKNIRKIYKTTDEDRYLAFIQHRDNKTLSIHSSTQKAYESSFKLKDSAFTCSKSNKMYSLYRDNKVMDYLEKNKRFENKVLCSTTSIEGGVDIIDTKLDLIAFSGYFNKDVVEQIAGRKRFISDDDVLDFVILEPSKGTKSIRTFQIEKDLSDVARVEKDGFEAILKERKNKTTKPSWARIEDNEELTIDYTKVEEMKAELAWLYEIKDSGISNYISKMHGLLESQIEDLDIKELEINIFEKYLDKKMFKKYNEDVKEHIGKSEYMLQDEFKEFLKSSYGLRARNGSKGKSIGIDTVNGFFKDNNVPYEIISAIKECRINGRRKKLTYWELTEII
ncbi:DEAD/DEAH box helicase family protein [Paraclostridium bifermentans]|uniref:DEAD/DEAH box helicase family protein n=1 Tax=Paraclostridium bifermentans TaxID=1490 RepID=A0AA44IGB2_PARBF|nr:DEAD/DEAH box helicase family protein [Paraclostridium bifermentans]MBN8047280.1 DEAD/DEAH box helicase family protein [Paraclostridium bifermentans]NME08648.1 DEAD/DEAH box helicase family protein [Paraclostridium bifermentans]